MPILLHCDIIKIYILGTLGMKNECYWNQKGGQKFQMPWGTWLHAPLECETTTPQMLSVFGL